MDLKEKIKRDLEIIALDNMDNDKAISEEIGKPLSFKERIRRIPFVGSVAWYLYNLLKSPFKIRTLTLEKEELSENIQMIKRDINEIKAMLEFIKNDFNFRYSEPEEYKIIDISDYIPENMKQNGKDFYALFENSFRSEDLDKKFKKYISFIEESLKNTDYKAQFIDIGCGRGEFLKLLKAFNLSVKGVEINKEYCEVLQKEGFDVHFGDGVEYLKTLEDDTLLGVSAIHVIEHIDFTKLKDFIEISYKKIKPDGLMLIETPNPKCSVALANFYIDYSHIRPCPYELVSFLFEYVGFKDIKLIMSSPVDRAFRTGNPLGDYMDYTLIGYKR